MKRQWSWTAVSVVLGAVLLVPACGTGDDGAGDESGVPQASLERARQVADAMTGELKKKLAAEMAQGGAAGAIRVCSEIAPEVARQHSVDGISVRRVSLKVRNPEDRPDEWEKARLVELHAAHDRGELPDEVYETVSVEDGTALRYLKPIKVGAVCVNCHGDAATMDPSVVETIRETYPEDEAIGYSPGDLRGAVSVRVALEEGA